MTKHPTKVNELPGEAFYAILYPENTTIPGDERSRTNPGHGYPEHTVWHWRMEVYASREEWAAEVERLGKQPRSYGQPEFKAVKVIPAKVATTVQVIVED